MLSLRGIFLCFSALTVVATAAPVLAEIDLTAADIDTLLFVADSLDDLYPDLENYTCDRLDAFAYVAVPLLVYDNRRDLLYDFVQMWEGDCSSNEPLDRVRLLAAIWDRDFSEGLYGAEIADRLAEYNVLRTDPHRSLQRQEFDAFTVDFADQLLPHMPDRSLEQFFCLFYSDRTERAWQLLDSEELEDTWLRYHRDQELAWQDARSRPYIISLTSGFWHPRGNVAFAGDHATVGAMFEQQRQGRFFRLVGEVRLGRTDRPYRVEKEEISGRSNRFDAFYIGVEGGLIVLRHGRQAAEVFAGVGYDGVRPFKDESLMLGTVNANLGLGWRWRPAADKRWIVRLDGRREWISERNEGVDSMSGGAWSLRLGLGLIFDEGTERDRAALGE